MISEAQTYYEILELTPDATPQEIRAAYLRAKSAYRKDSVALYTLISPEETESLLKKIEEAYQVLSSPERRREYDRLHGSLMAEETFLGGGLANMGDRQAKVVSIDRVPPMESGASEADLLVPPATDFTAPPPAPRSASHQAAAARMPEPEPADPFSLSPAVAASSDPFATIDTPTAQAPPIKSPASDAPSRTGISQPGVLRPSSSLDDPGLSQEIREQVEWRGIFLRRVREARNISIEEMCEYTKITKTYLFAVEEENFERLPAAVYLRGFVSQIAKYLRLPHEKVAAAYMGRHAQWRQEKENPKR